MSDLARIAEMVADHQALSGHEPRTTCKCGWTGYRHSEHVANTLITAGCRITRPGERFPVTVESRCRAIEVTRRGHLSAGHMVDAIIAALRDDSQ